MTLPETRLIEKIKKMAAGTDSRKRLITGIGDDTAVLKRPGGNLLFAADMLMDGTHFNLQGTEPELIGRKALAVNLSDIAAMAGIPLAVTVSLAIPDNIPDDIPLRIMSGLSDLAKEYEVTVCGGDTNIWKNPLVIDVAVIGEATGRGPVLRGGAQPGDHIFVTGPLGLSILGRHLRFCPRLSEAQYLHKNYLLTSMIDISDGLAKDLRHVLEMSGGGATLNRESIPLNRNPDGSECSIDQALADGEDFELCFTVARDAAEILKRDTGYPGGPLHEIGVITPERGLRFADGQEITISGYEHGVR
jgi:thiamine-monophosphate kinase